MKVLDELRNELTFDLCEIFVGVETRKLEVVFVRVTWQLFRLVGSPA